MAIPLEPVHRVRVRNSEKGHFLAKNDTLLVLAAAYDDVATAQADYDTVKELFKREGSRGADRAPGSHAADQPDHRHEAEQADRRCHQGQGQVRHRRSGREPGNARQADRS